MLERAVGCLESAGQSVFRSYNGMVRSRKTLKPGFWRSKSLELETKLWYFILSHISAASRRRSPDSSKSSVSTPESPGPFLDFLYPPKTLSVAASWLSRHRSNQWLRKKKRSVPDWVRPFASHSSLRHVSVPSTVEQPEESRNEVAERERVVRENKALLVSLLNSGDRNEYDRIWQLWNQGGQPSELQPRVLEYLSSSRDPIDLSRAKSVLDKIEVDRRTADVYCNGVISLLHAGQFSHAKQLLSEALARNQGLKPLGASIAFFLDTGKWKDVAEMWASWPSTDGPAYDHQALSPVASLSTLPQRLSSLLEFANQQPDSDEKTTLASLASCLLHVLFKSTTLMRSISMETILQLTQQSKRLEILEKEHYNNAITTLRSFEIRSTVVKSMIMYRNFRWHLKNVVPWSKILEDLLQTLEDLEIPHGVRYLLDEFRHFFGKPSIEAYKRALVAFARSGCVDEVYETFDSLLQDHGKPVDTSDNEADLRKTARSLRWISPVLHVHARLGQASAAQAEFDKIEALHGLRPNRLCWNVLISAYANAHDAEGAIAAFKRMRAAGVRPDSFTIGTLMAVCARKGDIDGVRNLFSAAQRVKVRVTTPMVDTIVQVLCRNNRLDDAEQLAEAVLFLKSVEGSRTRMWNTLLWSHAFRADLDSLSRIQSRMDAAGIRFDEMTYAALMTCLCILGKPDSARRLLRILHHNRKMHATELHYTIILYGYVRQRNRDMIHVIYREIEERFGNPGLSARLLMLREFLTRESITTNNGADGDESREAVLSSAENILMKAISEFETRTFATKHPRPATNRLPLHLAFPALYYEPLIKAYASEGSHERVEALLKRLERATGRQISLRFVSILMEAYLQAGNHDAVERCWQLALNKAFEQARPVNVDPDLLVSSAAEEGQGASQPPQPQTPHGGESILEKEAAQASKKPSVLPAQRFILSRCFSLYLRALGETNQTSKIPEVAAAFEQTGFVMTTANWLTYVREMASSPNPSDQLEAFRTFEQKFMPNFPGWDLLRRGIVNRPPDVPDTIDHLDRTEIGKLRGTLGKAGKRLWSKINPTMMQPSYNVMVHLAAALIDFRARSAIDSDEQLDILFSIAPRTLRAIAAMPHYREKFQGVLLRQRLEGGLDKYKSPRQPYVWTGGVLGVEGRKHVPKYFEEQNIPQDGDDDSDEDLFVGSTPGAKDSTRGSVGFRSLHHETPDDVPPSDRIMDPQDEHDIETETLLESRYRARGLHPRDDEEPPLDDSSRSRPPRQPPPYRRPYGRW
ncbi:hypothetical protein VTN49DRAFT_4746 [Thermomyces lanuginosus]|uniref:uncharacterized protein n=1 Tax=Thermomyces lanuginosus TaxID=5541 RepID=UPI0037437109